MTDSDDDSLPDFDLSTFSSKSSKTSKKSIAELLNETLTLNEECKKDADVKQKAEEDLATIKFNVISPAPEEDSPPENEMYLEKKLKLFCNSGFIFFSLHNLTLSSCGHTGSCHDFTKFEKLLNASKPSMLEHVMSPGLSIFSSNSQIETSLSQAKAFIYFLLKTLCVHEQEDTVQACENVLKNYFRDQFGMKFSSEEIFTVLFNYGVDIETWMLLDVLPGDLTKPSMSNNKRNRIPDTWMDNLRSLLFIIEEMISNSCVINEELCDIIKYLFFTYLDSDIQETYSISSQLKRCIAVALEAIPEEMWQSAFLAVSSFIMSVEKISAPSCWHNICFLTKVIPTCCVRGRILQKSIAINSLKKLLGFTEDIELSLDAAEYSICDVQTLLLSLDGELDSRLCSAALTLINLCINNLDLQMASAAERHNLLTSLSICNENLVNALNSTMENCDYITMINSALQRSDFLVQPIQSFQNLIVKEEPPSTPMKSHQSFQLAELKVRKEKLTSFSVNDFHSMNATPKVEKLTPVKKVTPKVEKLTPVKKINSVTRLNVAEKEPISRKNESSNEFLQETQFIETYKKNTNEYAALPSKPAVTYKNSINENSSLPSSPVDFNNRCSRAERPKVNVKINISYDSSNFGTDIDMECSIHENSSIDSDLVKNSQKSFSESPITNLNVTHHVNTCAQPEKRSDKNSEEITITNDNASNKIEIVKTNKVIRNKDIVKDDSGDKGNDENQIVKITPQNHSKAVYYSNMGAEFLQNALKESLSNPNGPVAHFNVSHHVSLPNPSEKNSVKDSTDKNFNLQTDLSTSFPTNNKLVTDQEKISEKNFGFTNFNEISHPTNYSNNQLEKNLNENLIAQECVKSLSPCLTVTTKPDKLSIEPCLTEKSLNNCKILETNSKEIIFINDSSDDDGDCEIKVLSPKENVTNHNHKISYHPVLPHASALAREPFSGDSEKNNLNLPTNSTTSFPNINQMTAQQRKIEKNVVLSRKDSFANQNSPTTSLNIPHKISAVASSLVRNSEEKNSNPLASSTINQHQGKIEKNVVQSRKDSFANHYSPTTSLNLPHQISAVASSLVRNSEEKNSNPLASSTTKCNVTEGYYEIQVVSQKESSANHNSQISDLSVPLHVSASAPAKKPFSRECTKNNLNLPTNSTTSFPNINQKTTQQQKIEKSVPSRKDSFANHNGPKTSLFQHPSALAKEPLSRDSEQNNLNLPTNSTTSFPNINQRTAQQEKIEKSVVQSRKDSFANHNSPKTSLIQHPSALAKEPLSRDSEKNNLNLPTNSTTSFPNINQMTAQQRKIEKNVVLSRKDSFANQNSPTTSLNIPHKISAVASSLVRNSEEKNSNPLASSTINQHQGKIEKNVVQSRKDSFANHYSPTTSLNLPHQISAVASSLVRNSEEKNSNPLASSTTKCNVTEGYYEIQVVSQKESSANHNSQISDLSVPLHVSASAPAKKPFSRECTKNNLNLPTNSTTSFPNINQKTTQQQKIEKSVVPSRKDSFANHNGPKTSLFQHPSALAKEPLSRDSEQNNLNLPTNSTTSFPNINQRTAQQEKIEKSVVQSRKDSFANHNGPTTSLIQHPISSPSPSLIGNSDGKISNPLLNSTSKSPVIVKLTLDKIIDKVIDKKDFQSPRENFPNYSSQTSNFNHQQRKIENNVQGRKDNLVIHNNPITSLKVSHQRNATVSSEKTLAGNSKEKKLKIHPSSTTCFPKIITVNKVSVNTPLLEKNINHREIDYGNPVCSTSSSADCVSGKKLNCKQGFETTSNEIIVIDDSSDEEDEEIKIVKINPQKQTIDHPQNAPKGIKRNKGSSKSADPISKKPKISSGAPSLYNFCKESFGSIAIKSYSSPAKPKHKITDFLKPDIEILSSSSGNEDCQIIFEDSSEDIIILE